MSINFISLNDFLFQHFFNNFPWFKAATILLVHVFSKINISFTLWLPITFRAQKFINIVCFIIGPWNLQFFYRVSIDTFIALLDNRSVDDLVTTLSKSNRTERWWEIVKFETDCSQKARVTVTVFVLPVLQLWPAKTRM